MATIQISLLPSITDPIVDIHHPIPFHQNQNLSREFWQLTPTQKFPSRKRLGNRTFQVEKTDLIQLVLLVLMFLKAGGEKEAKTEQERT